MARKRIYKNNKQQQLWKAIYKNYNIDKTISNANEKTIKWSSEWKIQDELNMNTADRGTQWATINKDAQRDINRIFEKWANKMRQYNPISWDNIILNWNTYNMNQWQYVTNWNWKLISPATLTKEIESDSKNNNKFDSEISKQLDMYL